MSDSKTFLECLVEAVEEVAMYNNLAELEPRDRLIAEIKIGKDNIKKIVLNPMLYEVLKEETKGRFKNQEPSEFNKMMGVPITVNEYLTVPYLIEYLDGRIYYG